MNRLIASLTLALPLAAGSGTAGAAHLRLSPSLYPRGTQITYQPHVSNDDMDCGWNFSCDWHRGHCAPYCASRSSLFHLLTQGQMRRVSGWSQLAVDVRGRQTTQFALYSSVYAAGTEPTGVPWSLRALLDFQHAALFHGYHALAQIPSLLPPAADGTVLGMQRRYGHVYVLLLASQSGTHEMEAMVLTTGGAAVQERMGHDLVRQMQAAGSELR